MSEPLTGHAVVEQAHDNSLLNTEPAVATGAIVGMIGAVGSILVIGGYLDAAGVEELKKQAGIIIPSIFIIVGLIQGIITRIQAYSPRSAARIAVANAKAPAGTPPVLSPPP